MQKLIKSSIFLLLVQTLGGCKPTTEKVGIAEASQQSIEKESQQGIPQEIPILQLLSNPGPYVNKRISTVGYLGALPTGQFLSNSKEHLEDKFLVGEIKLDCKFQTQNVSFLEKCGTKYPLVDVTGVFYNKYGLIMELDSLGVTSSGILIHEPDPLIDPHDPFAAPDSLAPSDDNKPPVGKLPRFLDYKMVSFLKAAATPEKYMQKKICVRGVLYWFGVETAVALCREHVQDGNIHEMILLKSGPALLKLIEKSSDKEKFNGCRVTVWGEVCEMKDDEMEAACLGEIERIVINGRDEKDPATQIGEME